MKRFLEQKLQENKFKYQNRHEIAAHVCSENSCSFFYIIFLHACFITFFFSITLHKIWYLYTFKMRLIFYKAMIQPRFQDNYKYIISSVNHMKIILSYSYHHIKYHLRNNTHCSVVKCILFIKKKHIHTLITYRE